MKDVYFWYKEVPDIDTRYEFDSKAYFDKLVYSEDKWSWVTDDIKKQEDSFAGIETSYGWSLSFAYANQQKTNIYGLVEFVYPGTPADKAGFKRGDVVTKMNNADITINNYTDLLYSSNMSCTFGQYTTTITNVKTVSMSALELNLDPVQFSKIVEHGGHKIGYLFYAQFIGDYNSSIDDALQNFRDNQITDLVIDLRYNPGGTTTAAQHLASSIAPVNVVDAEKTLVKLMWNDKYQKYWEDNNNFDQLKISFIKDVPIKLGLTKLYVITGQNTASASELIIAGLKPYMSVTTIGETTYGKYTASITVKPEDFYDNPIDFKDFTNWAVQPIVIKYANSVGFTDFKDGLSPDIPIEDDPLSSFQLGDKNEAMLKAALKEITGVEVIAMKSAVRKPEFKIFDRGFSKFDANKRELVFDGINKDFLK
jgi:C-terminal processing protease CtpA/Prc